MTRRPRLTAGELDVILEALSFRSAGDLDELEDTIPDAADLLDSAHGKVRQLLDAAENRAALRKLKGGGR